MRAGRGEQTSRRSDDANRAFAAADDHRLARRFSVPRRKKLVNALGTLTWLRYAPLLTRGSALPSTRTPAASLCSMLPSLRRPPRASSSPDPSAASAASAASGPANLPRSRTRSTRAAVLPSNRIDRGENYRRHRSGLDSSLSPEKATFGRGPPLEPSRVHRAVRRHRRLDPTRAPFRPHRYARSRPITVKQTLLRR